MERQEHRETISGLIGARAASWRPGDGSEEVKWMHSVWADLGCGEKRRRMGRGVVEHGEPGAVLTRA
jgi:hypothetical protein